VAFSRTLPAHLAPRFKGARRLICRTERASFEAVVAERFALRLRGLARLEPGAVVPLVFPRCRSLHTFGMRAPLDVVWLAGEAEWEVVAVESAVPPGRIVRAPRRTGRPAALELPAGDAEGAGLAPGARLGYSPT
jgi:uncharacterized membrane protein (UPF0127 family)